MAPQVRKVEVEKEEGEEEKEEKEDEYSGRSETLSFYELLSYADGLDWIMMVIGTMGSVVHGLAQPIGYLLLGKALNAYGNNIGDDAEMVKALNKVPQLPKSSCKVTD